MNPLTMDRAATLRVRTAPLITRWPCESCDDSASETETGAWYCRRHLSVTRDCETCLAIENELLAEVGKALRCYSEPCHHTPDDVLAEAIEADAGKFEAWAEGLGAVFDGAEFARRCGVGVAA